MVYIEAIGCYYYFVILNILNMVESNIVREICAHVNREGIEYSSWYVGIAVDPKKRLFIEHKVPKQNAWWIYRRAQTERNARDTEAYLLELGFAGGSSGGGSSTVYVYAYKILNGRYPVY